MLVINRSNQDITLINPQNKQSATCRAKGILNDIPDAFKDLPTFKNYVSRGILTASGDDRDNQDDVKEIAKEVMEIPQDVQDDLKRLNIPFDGDSDQEILLGKLKKAKKEYEGLVSEIQEGTGRKPHHKSNLETLRKIAKDMNKEG